MLHNEALAQLNRKIAERLPRPLTSDLHESGGLEQDADTTITIPPWHLREAKSDNEIFDMVVTKACHAWTGDVAMAFRWKFTEFLQQGEK